MRDRAFDRLTLSIVTAPAWLKLPALAVCAAATTVLVSATGARPSFLLANAVVAFSAWAGGFPAGAVAALGSLLAARATSPAWTAPDLLFALEALLIAVLVARTTAVVRKQRRQLTAAEVRTEELQSIARQGRAVEMAFTRLEEASTDDAMIMLDQEGRVAGWRAGARRLYGLTGEDALGMSAAALFRPPVADGDFRRLLTEANRLGVARLGGRQGRSDGTGFDADVDVRPLADQPGFTMLIRDRTRGQEWETFTAAAAEERMVLREEAAVAQRQLATLQRMTDPSLNALPAAHLATVLLDRLREAVEAGGVALVRFDGLEGEILSATDGLQPRGVAQARPLAAPAAARGLADGRTLLIQNDPARVGELTVVGWPETVSSLIAVPVLSGGRLEGAIEVVDARGRRSTEWEIALIQVVATRLSGFGIEPDQLQPRRPAAARPGRPASDLFVARNP